MLRLLRYAPLALVRSDIANFSHALQENSGYGANSGVNLYLAHLPTQMADAKRLPQSVPPGHASCTAGRRYVLVGPPPI